LHSFFVVVLYIELNEWPHVFLVIFTYDVAPLLLLLSQGLEEQEMMIVLRDLSLISLVIDMGIESLEKGIQGKDLERKAGMMIQTFWIHLAFSHRFIVIHS